MTAIRSIYQQFTEVGILNNPCCPACGRGWGIEMINIPRQHPYKCPKCDGKGALGFDPKCPPTGDTSIGADSSWICDQCKGTGVLWG